MKNLLVISAPAAAGVLSKRPVVARTGLAFLSFCLVSAAMYLINDVADVESDRGNMVKRHRPVASGRLSIRAALAESALLLAGAIAAGWTLGVRFEAAVALYAALTTAYSVWLREVAILDLALVASGFVIRAVAGGLAVHVDVSRWFLIVVSFGSLLVVAGKREAEYAQGAGTAELALDEGTSGSPATPEEVAPDRGQSRRPREYTVAYLRYVWMMASAVAIAGYCLWAFQTRDVRAGVPWSELSVIPFVLAILRYGLLLEAGHGGAPEDVLLRDRTFQVLAASWAVIYILGVYLGR